MAARHLGPQLQPQLWPRAMTSTCSAFPFCVPRGARLALSLFPPLLFHCYFSDGKDRTPTRGTGLVEEAKSAMSHLRRLHPSLSIAWIRQSVPYTPAPM